MSGERRCGPNVGVEKPTVWKDPDEGWVCDQAIKCSKCGDLMFDRLTDDDAAWTDALAAAARALPVPS